MDDTLNEDGDMGDDVDHYGDEEIVHSSANGGVPANVDSNGKPNKERITTPYMTKYEKRVFLERVRFKLGTNWFYKKSLTF